jgi:ABC-type glycerol-3-phosphate transport system substrate-binding protein
MQQKLPLPSPLFALLILNALLGVAGCRGSAEAGGRTVIEVWSGWTGHEGQVFQSLVDRFNKEHPTLYAHNLGGVQDDTKTIRAITAGVPPDAFFLWTPGYIGPLAANDALQPLDSRLASAGLRERDFVPVSLQLCRFQGRLYGLPVLIDGSALFWNRPMFREAGLDPDRPPRTPAELVEYSRRLTRRDAAGHLTRLGMDPPEPWPFLFAAGAPLVDASGHATADTPATRRALSWYRDLINAMGGASAVNSFVAGFGEAQSGNHPFLMGETAMMVNGEWMPYWIERWAPQLDYGIAPFPITDPHAPRTCSVGGNIVCIPRECRHPEAAWIFVSWLQTRGAQLEFARGIYNLPNRRDMLDEPSLTRGSRAARGYAVLLGLSASPGARAFPNMPITNFYQTELTNARDFVAHGDKTPEQALQDLQRRLDREEAR